MCSNSLSKVTCPFHHYQMPNRLLIIVLVWLFSEESDLVPVLKGEHRLVKSKRHILHKVRDRKPDHYVSGGVKKRFPGEVTFEVGFIR